MAICYLYFYYNTDLLFLLLIKSYSSLYTYILIRFDNLQFNNYL